MKIIFVKLQWRVILNDYTFLYKDNNKTYETGKDLLTDIAVYIYHLITQETWCHNLYEKFIGQPDTSYTRLELERTTVSIMEYTERVALEIYQTDIIHEAWKTNPKNIDVIIKKLYEIKKRKNSMESDFEKT